MTIDDIPDDYIFDPNDYEKMGKTRGPKPFALSGKDTKTQLKTFKIDSIEDVKRKLQNLIARIERGDFDKNLSRARVQLSALNSLLSATKAIQLDKIQSRLESLETEGKLPPANDNDFSDAELIDDDIETEETEQ